MKQRLNGWLAALWRRLNPPNPLPALRAENRALTQALSESQIRAAARRDEAHRFLAEMVEAQAMCGAGPWAPGNVNAYAEASKPLQEALRLREAGPVGDISPMGAYGMYELLLQNVNWQREINYSWLEFTRWGIQQIILICRLYYVKNPIVRRLVDVCAQYVFARGFDATTNSPAANAVIDSFFKRNQKVLGRVALMELEKSKDRDGNLFCAVFSDPATGECDTRIIDATEIQDIWCDPGDADMPQYYQRKWIERHHDAAGNVETRARTAWYPALNYVPEDCTPPQQRLTTIKGDPVEWDSPVYHRKVGAVGKWLFGCPRIYPMLDWAKEARRFLEACASVRQSLSQYASTVNTKGGQQAIEGIKQQQQTQVGPGAPIYDPNPPAVAGAMWISGPGTVMEAFKVQGATFSPDDVRWYVIFCCMCKGLPPTFLGDMQTSNLATATSLDRPTETVFLSLQEEWTEDLVVLLTYVLSKSLKAASGKLREAHSNPEAVRIHEAAKVRLANGRTKYLEAKATNSDDIQVRIVFPDIREGDVPALVTATVESMTLGNRGGQIVGVDEKEGCRRLAELVGIEDPLEMVEAQYPSKGPDKYDPNRTKEVLPPPIQKVLPTAGPQPAPAAVQATVATRDQAPGTLAAPEPAKEAEVNNRVIEAGFARVVEAITAYKEAYNEDQPRNEHGEWTSGGASEASEKARDASREAKNSEGTQLEKVHLHMVAGEAHEKAALAHAHLRAEATNDATYREHEKAAQYHQEQAQWHYKQAGVR